MEPTINITVPIVSERMSRKRSAIFFLSNLAYIPTTRQNHPKGQYVNLRSRFRAKIQKYFCSFLVQMKTVKFASEICLPIPSVPFENISATKKGQKKDISTEVPGFTRFFLPNILKKK